MFTEVVVVVVVEVVEVVVVVVVVVCCNKQFDNGLILIIKSQIKFKCHVFNSCLFIGITIFKRYKYVLLVKLSNYFLQ